MQLVKVENPIRVTKIEGLGDIEAAGIGFILESYPIDFLIGSYVDDPESLRAFPEVKGELIEVDVIDIVHERLYRTATTAVKDKDGDIWIDFNELG